LSGAGLMYPQRGANRAFCFVRKSSVQGARAI
jgi:hypothetical protein